MATPVPLSEWMTILTFSDFADSHKSIGGLLAHKSQGSEQFFAMFFRSRHNTRCHVTGKSLELPNINCASLRREKYISAFKRGCARDLFDMCTDGEN